MQNLIYLRAIIIAFRTFASVTRESRWARTNKLSFLVIFAILVTIFFLFILCVLLNGTTKCAMQTIQ
jgi:hypothetical protein